jgi:hypothetical protein
MKMVLRLAESLYSTTKNNYPAKLMGSAFDLAETLIKYTV